MGCGGTHGVFAQSIGLAVHEAHPFPKAPSIHRQDLNGLRQLIDPGFYFLGLGWILRARSFNSGSHFAQDYSREEELLVT